MGGAKVRSLIAKLVLSALTPTFLIAALLPVAQANTDEPERYRVEMPTEDGWHGVNFDNTNKDWALPSHLVAGSDVARNTGSREIAVCNGLDDPECLKSGWGMKARAIFDKCESARDRDCVVSFAAIKADGTRLEGIQKEVLPTKHAFSGDSKQGIPSGTGAGIWSIKDGSIESTYALVAGIELFVNGVLESRAAGNDSRIRREKMLFALQPVEMATNNEYRETVMSIEDGVLIGNSSSYERGCFISTNGRCGLSKVFPENLTYEVKVRFSKGVQGWMVGRIQDFKLAATPLPTEDGFEMTISGKASKIGAVITWSRWKDTSQAVRTLYDDGRGVDGVQWRPNKPIELLVKDGEARTILTYLNEAGEKSIRHFNAWLPLISDKATVMRTRWNVQSVADRGGSYDSCSQGKGIVGVINSNASVYSDGPPTFNKSTGTLEYQVAAPHYTSDGKTKHLGSYDLSMRSDVARCIYGFSSAPISATVLIESEGGTNIVSTESVTEKDGLIRLSAYGFTFSSPTIKVRLSQAAATPTPSATPTPVATPTVKKPAESASKKITCTKGKQRVKISATKGRCPAGFKRA
jgi:hypothetical protein